ncbi:unnamed protein product, partial [Mesorhabditis spiculigera]
MFFIGLPNPLHLLPSAYYPATCALEYQLEALKLQAAATAYLLPQTPEYFRYRANNEVQRKHEQLASSTQLSAPTLPTRLRREPKIQVERVMEKQAPLRTTPELGEIGMVFIVIRLVGEVEDRLFENIIVKTEISRIEFLKRIEAVTKIPIVHQQIQLRGEKLPDSLQPLLLAKDFDEVVVKHDGLKTWAACLVIADGMTKKKADHLKSKHAKHGVQLLNNLESANFFATYPGFYERNIDISDTFDRYVIGIEENIKLAVTSYFKNHYKDDQLAVNFLPKPDTGAQGGFICQVANGEFFVKNHTFMGRSSNHSRVDLRALFVYRVLHLMGAGAEPHFIGTAYSNVYVSKLALHIATKRVPGFQRRANRSTCNFSANHQMQLNLIQEIFYLSDLNSGNFGLDEQQRLFVVDFVVAPPKDCVHRASVFDQFRENTETCEEALRNWNLLENVNATNSSLLDDRQRLNRIIWRDGYDEYLENVLRNVNLFQNLFSQ